MENAHGETILTSLLTYQNQLRIFHWQTKSYSQHKSFGNAYEMLDDKIDSFLETFFGKYGRIVAASVFGIELDNYTAESFAEYNDDFITFLSDELPGYLAEGDSDLLNIRDDILGAVNRLKYLLTLN
jgi:hypothetical protein